MLDLSPELGRNLPPDITFDQLLAWPGEVFRAVKNRRTIRFEAGGQAYFMKIHRGAGWREIFKNLVQGRLPVLGAADEWRAIERLEQAGVATMTVAGKGARGRNPARRESLIITEALEGMITLEDLVRTWGGLRGARQVELKRALLTAVAEAARKCHRSGLNHRDFYICHFMVKDRDWSRWHPGEPLRLHVIDLHRAQVREQVPRRWLVKDLGALLFSSLDCGLTSADLLRFLSVYRQQRGAEVLREEFGLWRDAAKRAIALYRREHGRPPVLPRLLKAV